MKTRTLRATGLVLAAGLGAAGWLVLARSGPRARRASPSVVATVRVEVPAARELVKSLATYGEVGTGKTVGISFQRAGQVALLDAYVGKHVRAGSVLARLSPDPATVQAWDQAVTAMKLAEREWHRLDDLLALQLATRSQVDAAEKTFLDAQGTVKALQATGGGAGDSSAVAPFDGVVVATNAAQGDRVAAGAPILQVGHVDVLRVQLGVEPADMHLVRAGSKVVLHPVVGVNDTADAIASTVAEVQDVVDPKTLLANAVVVLRADEAPRLVPGMKVRADIEVARTTSLALPRDAVLADERGSYVYAITAGKAHRVAVTPGLSSGGYVAVAGLAGTQGPIVVAGNYELADGMDVKVAGGAP